MNAPIVTFFNNKGGVGKTTTLYNLSRMFARLGKRVLVVDLDPQANLTSLCLDDEVLLNLWQETANPQYQTIYHATKPVIEASGDIQVISPLVLEDVENYWVLAGDLRLGEFEDTLATEWNAALGGKASGLTVTSAFARLIQQVAQKLPCDMVFMDVAPNLGAINRSALIASDYVVVPLVPDLFALQGLNTVGKYLLRWRSDWQSEILRQVTPYPKGQMTSLGYILLQHRERQNRMGVAHQQWAERIPEVYAQKILNEAYSPSDANKHQLGLIKNYQSMMALSHETKKPIFDLKPADGAIGSHLRVVKEAELTYLELAKTIGAKIGISFDD